MSHQTEVAGFDSYFFKTFLFFFLFFAVLFCLRVFLHVRYIFFFLFPSFPFFLLLALSLCFARLCDSCISSNIWLNLFTSHQLDYHIACIIGVLWANRGKCGILCIVQDEGEENIIAPVTSPLFWLFHPPTRTNIDWWWWCQKDQWKHDPLLHYCHHSGYQKHRQQRKPLEITTTMACTNHQ